MTHVKPSPAVTVPFPIFRISKKVQRYMLYDIDVISWLRKTHNILGVLTGTLPQIPQQNVFLGLPLELQPEEARLLVVKKLAFIVNDLNRHDQDLASKDPKLVEDIRVSAHKRGLEAAKEHQRIKQDRFQQALEKIRRKRGLSEDKTSAAQPSAGVEDDDSDEILFGDSISRVDDPNVLQSSAQSTATELTPWTFTPASSYPMPTASSADEPFEVPNANAASYALYAHLHDKGYFITPGIRFGCQFSVYPGDPLRFHSHFLSMSYDWEEEIDLLDLVGGGRLGTGVKKGWLIGGPVTEREGAKQQDDEPSVRTFCIEWAGM